jgi:glycosyltransferase involved in cell wall biosynthesis
MDSPTHCYPELRNGLKVTATKGISCRQIFSATPAIQALEIANEVKDEYDVIHAHNFPSHIAATFVASKLEIPFIWQCNEPHRILHDTAERGRYIKHAIQESIPNRIMQLGALQILRFSTKTLDLIAAHRAFAITTLSNYEARILRSLYNVNPIVIHPGADGVKFCKDADRWNVREKFGIGGAPLILTVSRLWPAKNLETSLRAFRLVLQKLPSTYYMIVGDGPSKWSLLELSKQLGIDKRCIFVGDHDVGDRIDLFYAACDAYLFTPIGEPWGLTVLEAMQMAKPVVASADGGVTDLIQDHRNGILVNPLAPHEIAQHLIEVITNLPLASTLGSTAAATASQYSWKKMARSYDVLYQETISRDIRKRR